MNQLFSDKAIYPDAGLFIVRLFTGFFLIYHGWELFDEAKMNEYMQWDLFKNKNKAMVYAGKFFELAGGLLLAIGLFTRMAALMIIGTLGYIAFFVGQGKVWYEDQHPFMFVLLGLLFFFTGPGVLSLDAMLTKKMKSS